MPVSLTYATKIEQDGIIFEIFNNEMHVVGLSNEDNHDEVVIPASINYDGVTYIVTTIRKNSLYGMIKSLTIGPNITKIQTSTGDILDNYEILHPAEQYQDEYRYLKLPIKVIWMTNTPPDGYEQLQGEINYVSNELFTKLNNTFVYPLLSSMFEVDGVKYVPVSASGRTCDAIDCVYNNSSSNINIGKTVSYKGVSLTVKQICPFAFYYNNYIKTANLSFDGPIGEYGFGFCQNLKSIEIPDAITAIQNCCFRSCTSLKKALLGNGLKTIEKYAFSNCLELTDLQIGNNVDSIKWGAFAYCKALPFVKIPKAVTNIENFVFAFCYGLKTLIIEDQEIPSFMEQPKLLEDWESDTSTDTHTYEFHVNSGDILTFDYYRKTINIVGVVNSTISVTINGKEVQLEPTQTGVGTYSHLFDNNGLVTMTVKTIGTFEPYGIYNIIVGEKPQKALRLGSNYNKPLFSSCQLDSVYIGRKIFYPAISSQGYSPFYRNKTLRSVRITDIETTIPNNEFYGCTGLKNVWIGNRVSNIGNWAFSDCFSLDYFEFGNKMENIGKEAFSDCTNVTKIISHANIPPICDTQALDDINKWNCTLYVPNGAVAAYQAAAQWKEFFFVEVDTGIPQALGDSLSFTNYYSLDGQRIEEPRKGVNIVKMSDGTVKKIVIK